MIVIYDNNKKDILIVKASPESFVIQLGESADIVSKGKLRSTLHSLFRPIKLENLSREKFVLKSAWNKTFCVSEFPEKDIMFKGQVLAPSTEDTLLRQCKYKQRWDDFCRVHLA
ncbi:2-oxoglutarate (2OG) and Fe(II)-dependent oxygenase superfamily protein [Quillaja saponaria]|uniref:2-oxoglutarate (2OG) and Fe(II)-dependent oxygenase superfamily protein n=1 Tax=Quillaja saponaria TaxID=32244 RepID=A0AAD7VJ14_QUISA|nr:2-oxoglutarate (2OG) and Fe(II)-dependent oxygenase superfamily protein [Quillaja saponaria]